MYFNFVGTNNQKSAIKHPTVPVPPSPACEVLVALLEAAACVSPAAAVRACVLLTLPRRVQLVEPPQDVGHGERGGARRAVLPGDVGLLGEPRGHVVHDGHDDAEGVLGHRHPLGELELWGGTLGAL